jgi:hypothetical protein
MVDVRWPEGWQPEAKRAFELYFGSPARLDIWLGTAERQFTMRLAGNVYLDEGVPTIIHDYSGKWDIHPWPISTGPALRIYELRPRRRALILFADETWTPPGGEKGVWK